MNTHEELTIAMHESGRLGRSCDDQTELRWIPLLRLHADGHHLGLTFDTRWVADSASGLIDLAARDWYAPLLPLMERKLPDFVEELECALRVNGLPTEFARAFPFDEVIKLGLQEGSYWVERALAWLEDRPIGEELVPLLRSASEDKGRVQQGVRQHAERILRGRGTRGQLVGALPDGRKP